MEELTADPWIVLLNKLDHPLEEVQVRALSSVAFKVASQLLSLSALQGEKQITQLLASLEHHLPSHTSPNHLLQFLDTLAQQWPILVRQQSGLITWLQSLHGSSVARNILKRLHYDVPEEQVVEADVATESLVKVPFTEQVHVVTDETASALVTATTSFASIQVLSNSDPLLVKELQLPPVFSLQLSPPPPQPDFLQLSNHIAIELSPLDLYPIRALTDTLQSQGPSSSFVVRTSLQLSLDYGVALLWCRDQFYEKWMMTFYSENEDEMDAALYVLSRVLDQLDQEQEKDGTFCGLTNALYAALPNLISRPRFTLRVIRLANRLLPWCHTALAIRYRNSSQVKGRANAAVETWQAMHRDLSQWLPSLVSVDEHVSAAIMNHLVLYIDSIPEVLESLLHFQSRALNDIVTQTACSRLVSAWTRLLLKQESSEESIHQLVYLLRHEREPVRRMTTWALLQHENLTWWQHNADIVYALTHYCCQISYLPESLLSGPFAHFVVSTFQSLTGQWPLSSLHWSVAARALFSRNIQDRDRAVQFFYPNMKQDVDVTRFTPQYIIAQRRDERRLEKRKDAPSLLVTVKEMLNQSQVSISLFQSLLAATESELTELMQLTDLNDFIALLVKIVTFVPSESWQESSQFHSIRALRVLLERRPVIHDKIPLDAFKPIIPLLWHPQGTNHTRYEVSRLLSAWLFDDAYLHWRRLLAHTDWQHRERASRTVDLTAEEIAASEYAVMNAAVLENFSLPRDEVDSCWWGYSLQWRVAVIETIPKQLTNELQRLSLSGEQCTFLVPLWLDALQQAKSHDAFHESLAQLALGVVAFQARAEDWQLVFESLSKILMTLPATSVLEDHRLYRHALRFVMHLLRDHHSSCCSWLLSDGRSWLLRVTDAAQRFLMQHVSNTEDDPILLQTCEETAEWIQWMTLYNRNDSDLFVDWCVSFLESSIHSPVKDVYGTGAYPATYQIQLNAWWILLKTAQLDSFSVKESWIQLTVQWISHWQLQKGPRLPFVGRAAYRLCVSLMRCLAAKSITSSISPSAWLLGNDLAWLPGLLADEKEPLQVVQSLAFGILADAVMPRESLHTLLLIHVPHIVDVCLQLCSSSDAKTSLALRCESLRALTHFLITFTGNTSELSDLLSLLESSFEKLFKQTDDLVFITVQCAFLSAMIRLASDWTLQRLMVYPHIQQWLERVLAQGDDVLPVSDVIQQLFQKDDATYRLDLVWQMRGRAVQCAWQWYQLTKSNVPALPLSILLVWLKEEPQLPYSQFWFHCFQLMRASAPLPDDWLMTLSRNHVLFEPLIAWFNEQEEISAWCNDPAMSDFVVRCVHFISEKESNEDEIDSMKRFLIRLLPHSAVAKQAALQGFLHHFLADRLAVKSSAHETVQLLTLLRCLLCHNAQIKDQIIRDVALERVLQHLLQTSNQEVVLMEVLKVLRVLVTECPLAARLVVSGSDHLFRKCAFEGMATTVGSCFESIWSLQSTPVYVNAVLTIVQRLLLVPECRLILFKHHVLESCVALIHPAFRSKDSTRLLVLLSVLASVSRDKQGQAALFRVQGLIPLFLDLMTQCRGPVLVATVQLMAFWVQFREHKIHLLQPSVLEIMAQLLNKAPSADIRYLLVLTVCRLVHDHQKAKSAVKRHTLLWSALNRLTVQQPTDDRVQALLTPLLPYVNDQEVF